MNSPDSFVIPDVQSSADTRRLAIDKVGIKAIRHPVRVADKSGGVQHTIATFNMYVGLPHNFKGTHMSRFVEILNSHEREISVESFESMLRDMVKRLEAEYGHIEMTFPYFINKAAPVSGVKSLLDYDVTFVGEVRDARYTFAMKVVVPVTSLCPCSKEISDYGAHNQRSHVTITARTREHVWIEEIVRMAEEQASCELYGLLKRPDEKFVTERAYDNPKFVEDLVRDVATVLNRDKRIEGYVVESENFESIHNHSAYALIEKDTGRTEAAMPGCRMPARIAVAWDTAWGRLPKSERLDSNADVRLAGRSQPIAQWPAERGGRNLEYVSDAGFNLFGEAAGRRPEEMHVHVPGIPEIPILEVVVLQIGDRMAHVYIAGEPFFGPYFVAFAQQPGAASHGRRQLPDQQLRTEAALAQL